MYDSPQLISTLNLYVFIIIFICLQNTNFNKPITFVTIIPDIFLRSYF